MVITLVIDCYGDKNNGTTVTCMRTAKIMKEKGHEVRIIAYIDENTDPKDLEGFKVFYCKKVVLPFVDFLIKGNGYTFANADEKELADFIKGSDVVHLMVPFVIEAKCRKIAKILSIPTTSAYHLQPDTISYNIHLGKSRAMNDFIYYFFKRWLYKFTRTIHTPSDTMRELMIEHRYRGDIYAISNGVSPFFHYIKEEKPEELKNKFVILMIGRLSGEKKQDILMKAVSRSKYNDKIQLIFCGQGPRRKSYEKLSKKILSNPAQFKFVCQEELRRIINYSDLYVHASSVESEAIACVEAFVCGKLPIISDSKFSATNHFALDDSALFKDDDPDSLRDRIDYFIEHPEEREEKAKEYGKRQKEFDLEEKVDALIDMMRLEIERDKEDHLLNRTYYSTIKERKHLRKMAKKIKLEDPYIVKDDVVHHSNDFDNKAERKAIIIKNKKRAS